MMGPMTLAELAGRLGRTIDWLYRPGNLEKLYREGMPQPISAFGQRRYDRRSIEAWCQRHHPWQPKPANDPAPPPEPANDEAWRKRLKETYGEPR